MGREHDDRKGDDESADDFMEEMQAWERAGWEDLLRWEAKYLTADIIEAGDEMPAD